MSAILLICIRLKIKECGIRSVVGHIIVVVAVLQDKEKIIKDFHFYNNADEMKKKVFSKPLIFFSEEEDMTVDVDIRYVGRSKNIIAVD